MSAKVKIIDHGWNEIFSSLDDLDHSFVKVGFPSEGSPSSEFKSLTKSSGHEPISTQSELVTIASTHEFGSKKRNIPERPFVSTAYDENISGLAIQKKKAYELILKGRSLSFALGRLGEWFVSKVKRKITQGPHKDLSEITKARKGSTRPLIDTGQMRASVQQIVFVRGNQVGFIEQEGRTG